MCARCVIFPGRHQPSIVTVNELNYCVRNGNRCTLITINTHFIYRFRSKFTISFPLTSVKKNFGDPWENRTPVCGVRGRRLNRLTNGPFLPDPAKVTDSFASPASQSHALKNMPPASFSRLRRRTFRVPDGAHHLCFS